MKRRFLLVLCLCVLIAGLMLFAGCKDIVYFRIDLPDESERVGYLLNINGVFGDIDSAKQIYNVPEGETVLLDVAAMEGYTLEDIVVRDNGSVLTHTDVSNEFTIRYSYEISSIAEKHTITVEGVRKITNKVTLALASYENEDGTKVKYASSDLNMLNFKWGNTYYPNAIALIGAIN